MIRQDVLKKILCVITLFLVLPINVKAYNLDTNYSKTVGNFIQIADSCDTNDETILGNVDCEDSVAWLLQKILNYIRVIGPSLAVVLSAIDFTKVIVTSDNDSMKKTQQKLIWRLAAAALLFFVPTITMVLLDLLGLSGSNATAGLK